MDRLILLENIFYFVVFIGAFYLFTKGRWRRSRPSAAEEMTLSGKTIKEMLDNYLDKPLPPTPPVPEPEPQNVTVPKHVIAQLPPPPTRFLHRKVTTTQSPTFENIKKGLLYDIIWKRKYGK